MALHVHGSTNPLGISNNIDRLPFHSYFVFKDLVTVFLLLLIFSLFVFFSPNTLGFKWPLILSLLYNYISIIIKLKKINNKLIYNIKKRGKENCTICWNYLPFRWLKGIYNKTNAYLVGGNNISDNFNNFININLLKLLIKINYPRLVKYYYKRYNQQQTKIVLNLWVGCSETIRTKIFIPLKNKISTLSYDNDINLYLVKIHMNKVKSDKFNEWLAGLIDGDGYFGVIDNKYTSCEITVSLEDEKMLRQIQNKFGGSIKLRSGIKTIRYRLQNKEGMIKLINAINGNIRHNKRLVQLSKVCNILNIDIINPIPLNFNNAWFSGFFDADGSINYYYRDINNKLKIRPQLTICVTNKLLSDIQPFKDIFGGNIYFDKSQNGYFKWSININNLHMLYYQYNKICPSRSHKGKRLFLIKEFYYLYNLRAFRYDPTSSLFKAWLKFDNKWNNYTH